MGKFEQAKPRRQNVKVTMIVRASQLALIWCLSLSLSVTEGFLQRSLCTRSAPGFSLNRIGNIPQFHRWCPLQASSEDDETTSSQGSSNVPSRRDVITSLITFASVAAFDEPSLAFEKSYPAELVQGSLNDLDSRERRKKKIIEKEKRRVAPLALVKPLDWVLWGGALWFLSGSRSNPLATPLANAIYKVDDEKWIQDRNEGLFAALPWDFLVILGFVFFALGAALDTALVALSDGDVNLSLELAGVSLIAGGALELGRIASGEKKQTREEVARSELLRSEFDEFATNRLLPGGNCHRNEVVASFRRYFSQYRDADNEDSPLSDVEIEQLLRSWSRSNGLDMSSAGFYNGIQINKEADVFKSIW